MGFNVGTLNRVPLDLYDHYIFVLGDPEISSHAKWVDKNFGSIARSLPAKTAIVSGTNEQLTDEINQLIADWSDYEADKTGWELFNLLADSTMLVIARGNIRTTDKPLILVPLSLPGVMDGVDASEEELEQFMAQIFGAICEAIRRNELDQLLAEIGAAPLPLKSVRSGAMISTLKRANKVLDLKPSFLGFGVNLNAIIDGWLLTVKDTR
jgi:hypothetical protein